MGASPEIFSNAILEGLTFLKDLFEGRVALPGDSEMIADSSLRKIVTNVYYNDIRFCFDEIVRGVLRDNEVTEAYGRRKYEILESTWSVLTPESTFGSTVLLVQGLEMPRVMDYADLEYKMEDDGRRNVHYSRACVHLSSHMAAECFEADRLPPHWKFHKM